VPGVAAVHTEAFRARQKEEPPLYKLAVAFLLAVRFFHKLDQSFCVGVAVLEPPVARQLVIVAVDSPLVRDHQLLLEVKKQV
jgi:hypothetical protein